METITQAATAEAIAVSADRIIRREFFPPYANPPISNYRKLWASTPSAFWSAFGVRPGDGSVVNQLGTNPTTCSATAFQDVGFGYTFKAALTTDYWFDVDIDAGPVSSNGATNTIGLELWGSNASPVVVPLNCRFLKTTATLSAYLTANCQYTLIFKSKVALSVAPGQTKYGEVIARFPRLVVSYVRPWGIEGPVAESAQDESIDLGQALEALKADEEGDVLLQPVSFKEIAQAGSQGFGGFSDGN
ncbi:MAG TPA: hypothetical protein VKM72_22040 [Thermoanaerobaculia bacterium]|nr:hypothetical protein [Thermoanaerobaculia bacterium]